MKFHMKIRKSGFLLITFVNMKFGQKRIKLIKNTEELLLSIYSPNKKKVNENNFL